MSGSSIIERKVRSESARAARREEILGAARAVFSRQGFRGTTIADIAEEAGIALGTIYLYFPSKDDVFAALNEELNELIAGSMTNAAPADTLDAAVRSRVNNVFAACANNRDLVQLVVLNTDPESATSQRLRKSDDVRTSPLAKVIEEAAAQGQIRRGDPWIMTKLAIGAVSMAVYQAFVLADGRGWEKYRDACGDMLVAYFTPPRKQRVADSG
jgi:AcrR family transcriptional regulator